MNFDREVYKKNNPVYSDKDIYENPKEYFKTLKDLVKKRFKNDLVSIVDLGCSSGAFLFYLKEYLNIKTGIGMDISDSHLNQARKVMPNFNFIEGSILDLSSLKKK